MPYPLTKNPVLLAVLIGEEATGDVDILGGGLKIMERG